MAVVVLSLHLLVCICLIGLVLLQRSEGGALGMGGGGGGALMSGRGAADALAKMTTFAGGFFLVTSLGLTVISGAAQSSSTRSVFDLVPQQTQQAPVAPAPAAPADETTRPDPLESSAPESAQTQLASAPAPQITLAPAPAAASTRAGPVSEQQRNATAAPSAGANNAARTNIPVRNTAAPQGGSSQTVAANVRPPAPSTTRTNTQTGAAPDAPAANTARAPALVIPNTSGANGSGLQADDGPVAQLNPESGDAVGEPVRRERAGPDQ